MYRQIRRIRSVNGRIYALGGQIDEDPVNTVEVFTPGSESVNESSANFESISIFPNPTTGLVSIRGAAGTITVTNVLGQTALTAAAQSGESLTLDLANESAGIYFVRIETAAGPVIQKIIRE